MTSLGWMDLGWELYVVNEYICIVFLTLLFHKNKEDAECLLQILEKLAHWHKIFFFNSSISTQLVISKPESNHSNYV